jgi:hypothetical protein
MITIASLKDINWLTAARTYGNDHATLIGLFVAWWNNLDEKHRALEGGPSDGGHNHGTKRGWVTCDALLLSNETDPAFVLEVEGTDYEKALRRIRRFFEPPDERVKPKYGAILCAYAYAPKGKGDKREFPRVESQLERVISGARELLKGFPDKIIAVVTIDKELDRAAGGIREKNEYYPGTVKKVAGIELRHGSELGSQTYYAAP